jgi:flagellar protein FliO/FliZ
LHAIRSHERAASCAAVGQSPAAAAQRLALSVPWRTRPAVLAFALIVLLIALLITVTAAQAAAAHMTLLQTGTAARAAATASASPATPVPATLAPAALGTSALSAFAAPAHAGAPSTAGGLLRVTLALIVVLAAIFGAGWLSRRVHGTRGTRHPGLEVLAQLPLGPRERAVLIRVGAQQLLVGVCGGCVRTLHVCAPEGVAAGTAAGTAAGSVAGTAAIGSVAEAGAGADMSAAAALTRPTFKALLLKGLGR